MGIHFFVLLDRANLLRPFLGAPLDFSSVIFALTVPCLSGRRFTSREELVQMIENYIAYYNNRRVQRNLGVLTPMEKHYSYPLAA